MRAFQFPVVPICCNVSGLLIRFQLCWSMPKLAIEDHAAVLHSDTDFLNCLETWQDRATEEAETASERFDLG